MLTTIFNEVLYRPIFNALVFLYNIIPGHDFGIAIILFTFFIIIILSPFSYKLIKSRKEMSTLQPKIKEIQKKFKDKQEQSRELMNLYKKHKVSPFSGCLPLLIQLPILFALYRALINVLQPENLSVLYSFVKNPGIINPLFLGIVDLSIASPVLAVLAAISQFFYSKITMKYSTPTPPMGDQKGSLDIQKRMTKQMSFIGPIIILIFGLRFPAGLTLYWLAYALLTSARDYYFSRKFYGKNQENN